jgi:hypothetical protein
MPADSAGLRSTKFETPYVEVCHGARGERRSFEARAAADIESLFGRIMTFEEELA